MKKVYKSIVTLLLVCTIFTQPKAVAWWNIIYSYENEMEEDEPKEVKFFFLELFESIWSCKKR